ncbi:MAG: hypothetical protein M5U14_13825 [Acidimicrobiia bacterium]|nr:hypothetical protein [Acidimicrobiia bacterium]
MTDRGEVHALDVAEDLGACSDPGASPHQVVGIAASHDGAGAWVATTDGSVRAFGGVEVHGSLPGLGVETDRAVGITGGPRGGYWLVTADGAVFCFGGTEFAGSLPEDGRGVSDVVGLVAAEGVEGVEGYLLVAGDGAVFVFGSAPYLGSLVTGRGSPRIVGIDAVGGWYRPGP